MGTPDRVRLAKALELAERQAAELKLLRAEVRKPHRDPAAEALRAEVLDLRKTLRVMERALKPLQAEHDEMEEVAAAVADAEPPAWAISVPRGATGIPGVPTILATDWHVGETVRPELVYGKNRYDQPTTEARVQRFIAGTIDLLSNHVVNPHYPGIVMPIGGDMVSGSIHEELEITSWCDLRTAARLTTGYLIKAIEAFAERFGHVYVPCVTGNHGRLTKRMQYKRRVGTSVDAMIYDGVASWFRRERNETVRIEVAEGTSIRYRVYNHRYLLAHGDPWSIGARGGDGFIGSIGPIVRGSKKILGRNAQIDLEADTFVMGHYHRRVPLPQVIVGDSMVGFNEMSVGEGYDYAPPSQELWLTHPDRGPTIHAPVFLEAKKRTQRIEPWVSFEHAAT